MECPTEFESFQTTLFRALLVSVIVRPVWRNAVFEIFRTHLERNQICFHPTTNKDYYILFLL
jgi:hypothetical protein